MTDWIEHTTDTCPVDPETVVEVRVKHGASIVDWSPPRPARRFRWPDPCITHYRIITPAPTPPLFLGGDPVKPPEPEMTQTHDDRLDRTHNRLLPGRPGDGGGGAGQARRKHNRLVAPKTCPPLSLGGPLHHPLPHHHPRPDSASVSGR